MRPSGPRVRNDPRQQRRPDPSERNPPSRTPAATPADRDQVFASIFGRPAGGHHSAAAHQTPSSSAPQGYGYSPNVPAQGYPQQQDPYRHTGRQPISNGGYEAFAPPLPPPAPPNGSVGMGSGVIGGLRERPAGRADYASDHNAYTGYPYQVSSNILKLPFKHQTHMRLEATHACASYIHDAFCRRIFHILLAFVSWTVPGWSPFGVHSDQSAKYGFGLRQ